MEGFLNLGRRLSVDNSTYAIHTLKRGSVDFTIESSRNGVPYGLQIERGPNPSEPIEFIWMKDHIGIVEVFYWDYKSPESTEELHKFCHRLWTHFQEDLLPLRVVAEKAMRCVYQLWNHQADMHKELMLKNRLRRGLLDRFYREGYSHISRTKLVTFLVLEEGLGFLVVDSLVHHLSLYMELIEEFLIN